MIKNQYFFIFPFCSLIFTFSCSEPKKDLKDVSKEKIENVVIKDPDDLDYWNEAKLVWSDEFEGSALSLDNWVFETGTGGWGNNELQNYRPVGHCEVSNGTLKITAKQNTDTSLEGAYTSARLNSKKDFMFGKMEIRAKMPDHKGNGIWPALWMLGSNIENVGWPSCGEIDIMEYVSYLPGKTHFALHSKENNHTNGTELTSGAVDLETIEEDFHIFGLLWSNKYIKFYIDDIDNIKFSFRKPKVSNTDNWPFSNKFYFLMNIAVGGNWGGIEGVDDAVFPAVMEVDYVRVYQVKE